MRLFSRRPAFPSRAAALLCLLCFLLPLSGFAQSGQFGSGGRVVEVLWVDSGQEAEPKSQALARGFGQAVFEEALELLPATLPPDRRELLRDYLNEHLGEAVETYVTSYSELGGEDDLGGKTLYLDVSVNREALRDQLKALGIYFTADAPATYSLALSGAGPEAWHELGRLQALSGLLLKDGAEPLLTLTRSGGEGEGSSVFWAGRLQYGEESREAVAATLPEVWTALWAAYFTGEEIAASNQAARSGDLTRISGFSMPDGVETMAREMASWRGLVEQAELVRVELSGGEVSGVFRLRVRSPEAFAARLAAYLPERGLTRSSVAVAREETASAVGGGESQPSGTPATPAGGGAPSAELTETPL